MTKTIRQWMSYYEERYGRSYRIRIEKENVESKLYYWWEIKNIPKEILDLPVKRIWSHYYTEEHGIRERELEIIY